MTVTHVTEFGLGICAGLVEDPTQIGYIGPAFNILRGAGLLPDTLACDGRTTVGALAECGPQYGVDVLGRSEVLAVVPTCPRCAVLRDEALEGRLPQRDASGSFGDSPGVK